MPDEKMQRQHPPGPCGEGALPLLLRFLDRIPAGGRVLEIGAGRGERALPLARRGWSVTATESDPSALAALRQAADSEGLEVDLREGGPLTAGIEGPFHAVLIFDRLQELTRSEAASLLYRVIGWLAPGGLLMLTTVHVDDPCYDLCRDKWRRIGLHSFRSAQGMVRTFLARSEILDLFIGWNVIFHCEGQGPAHSHAPGCTERHGVVELVARKPRDA